MGSCNWQVLWLGAWLNSPIHQLSWLGHVVISAWELDQLHPDWEWTLNSFPQRNVSCFLLTFGMFHSLDYFLLTFYVFQKPVRITGFDKHFEDRRNPNCFPLWESWLSSGVEKLPLEKLTILILIDVVKNWIKGVRVFF